MSWFRSYFEASRNSGCAASLYMVLSVFPLLLAVTGLIHAVATSPFFLGPTLNSDGKYFGPFGVVVALIGWGFVLTTMSMACAVFSPVWAEWREAETATRRAPQPATRRG